jgi:hypothetical protein
LPNSATRHLDASRDIRLGGPYLREFGIKPQQDLSRPLRDLPFARAGSYETLHQQIHTKVAGVDRIGL